MKFYDGNQTSADPWLASDFTTGDYALDSNFIGTGNAYAIVTYKIKKGIWRNFPQALFVIDGIELLNAETGADSTTHDNPVDFIYTVMRGIEYDGDWFYGSQKMQPSQLAGGDWGVQRQKCIDANYILGGEITVATSAIDSVAEALASCGGRMAESGGQFRMLAVEPDASVASFVDDDIISTESRRFTPFIGLSNAINGISVVYPSPEDGWQNQTAPPLIVPGLEAEDDNRRLMSDIDLPFVTGDAQVQRLMQNALQEARRARKHTITLPSNFWQVEPLDVVQWTSARNGYVTKSFIVDGIVDQVNGDEIFDLTEIDISDYSWNSSTDFTSVSRTSIASPLPPAQDVAGWTVTTEFLIDANGNATTPGFRIHWNGNVSGVDHLIWQIRLAGSRVIVLEGMSLDVESGERLLANNFLLNTDYEIRARYIPTTDRATSWTSWTLASRQQSEEPIVDISDFLSIQGETIVTSLRINVASASDYYRKAQIRWKLN